uniref:Uncharacterized protein n=1 Tax=Methylophaga nitratireducenticrescens TaxID=754476 RepID=I1XJY4_METNJ
MFWLHTADFLFDYSRYKQAPLQGLAWVKLTEGQINRHLRMHQLNAEGW